jgi:hypothetical protein
MLVVEFADFEIGSAAERYRTGMAKDLPKSPRTLYRRGRARAGNRFTGNDAAAIIEIKRQCHEKSDFSHTFATFVSFPPAHSGGRIALIGEKHQGSFSYRA